MWEGDLWVAVRAARAGAEVVRRGFDEPFETEMKGTVDPVTDIDREAELAITDVIADHFPDDSILAEEGGGVADWRGPRVWIIDPLDGTVNFVNRIPQVAVSVALWDNGEPLVWVVIDVSRQEEYVAAMGEGARCNDQPIHVSNTASMESSVLVTGFPYDHHEHAGAYLSVMEQVMTRSRGTRRMGAAALDMAWVACGRFDGYWEHGGPQGVKPWDAAAGMLLVTEAGGTATDNKGVVNDLEPAAFVVTNGKIHEDLRVIIDEHMPAHLR
ncbi:MAG TPA: inositol monophosphatase family protein [Acidimicrobiia bacterium]|nr:inositol monophosphatase family protein [Acidimicrobiia bacterium]